MHEKPPKADPKPIPEESHIPSGCKVEHPIATHEIQRAIMDEAKYAAEKKAKDDETFQKTFKRFAEDNRAKHLAQKDIPEPPCETELPTQEEKGERYAGGTISSRMGAETPKGPLSNPVPYPLLFDSITHPAHYCRGGIEARYVIRAWGLTYHLGTALAYICRAYYKGYPVQDLRKAIQHLSFEIEDIRHLGLSHTSPGGLGDPLEATQFKPPYHPGPPPGSYPDLNKVGSFIGAIPMDKLKEK